MIQKAKLSLGIADHTASQQTIYVSSY